MKPRIDSRRVSPKIRQYLLGINAYLHGSTLGSRLLHLIEIRASQINGCAQCLDMHTQDARAEGETEQRLYALDAWRETPFFDEHERAALEWTEAVTLVAETHVPDEVYERVRQHFNEQELIDLTLAVTQINTWNRLNVACRTVPGSYRAGMYKEWLAAAEQSPAEPVSSAA
ncbi:MAG TPA: carboxymuconolactone decarboxylase family protein [Steroidobacteraceae bacterium]|nr:carboxymuconolactone decarboxylase family protein [Steroidobacteraceae bacterium]